MRQQMKNWLKPHQILAATVIALLGLQVLAYVFLLSPRRNEIAELRYSVENKRQRLHGATLPLDANKLEAFLDSLKKGLQSGTGGGALAAKAAEATARADSTFKPTITRDYGSVKDFILNVSLLDYQSEYNRIISSLAAKGVTFSPEKLHLTEEMSTPFIYQIVMQLWTVEKLCGLALDAGLTIRKEQAAGRRPAPALVSVMPMKAYFMSPKDAKPYLLEFPVCFTVEGALDHCMQFIRSLEGDNGVFLPVCSFEIFSLPPHELKAQEDGNIRPGPVAMKLTCSSFLVTPTK